MWLVLGLEGKFGGRDGYGQARNGEKICRVGGDFARGREFAFAKQTPRISLALGYLKRLQPAQGDIRGRVAGQGWRRIFYGGMRQPEGDGELGFLVLPVLPAKIGVDLPGFIEIAGGTIPWRALVAMKALVKTG